MKEPGLDERHRDKDGQIQQKRSDTLNKNLPKPIEGFSPSTTLTTMREKTGKVERESHSRSRQVEEVAATDRSTDPQYITNHNQP